MASFPTVTYIYDRYKKASSNRKGTIEMRITYNRKQKYISTGISVYPKEWRRGEVVNTSNAQELNNQLAIIMSKVRQILTDMINNNNINIYAIADKLNSNKIDLFKFMRERATIREYGKSKDTKERYERFLRLFKQWGFIKNFEDITEDHIIMYDEYLSSQGMKNYSKWQNYHRFLNSFIIDAIDAGYIKKNPYKWINIEKDKTTNGLERCLTPLEFNRLKRVKLPTECLEKVRDVFVFQTYTCLSYADLRDFDVNNIIKVKDMKVYIGNRDKTSKQFTIPLLPEALLILKRYNNILPVISNVKYNQYLKIVAQAAGINKPVSTHYARHTGATMLLNQGISMQIVSKICGHSSTKITEQVYAKLLDETIVDAIKKIL